LVSIAKALKIQDFLKSLGLDEKKCVYYSYWCNDAALALALMKKENPELKAVSRVHGWDVYFEASEIGYLPYRPFIAKHLNAIVPISNKGRDYIRDFWGVDKLHLDKIQTHRLGVSAGVSSAQKSIEFHVVTCSNVIPLKRLDLFIEALSQLPGSIAISWTHFGDGVLFEEIKRQASALNDHISIEFKGRISNEEVLRWYAETKPSLFVNVSSTEGVPVSIMEAQSHGIPVVATDVGGTGEIVNENVGMLIGANLDASEIASALMNFYDMDTESYESLVERVQVRWEQMSDAEKNFNKFAEFLKKI